MDVILTRVMKWRVNGCSILGSEEERRMRGLKKRKKQTDNGERRREDLTLCVGERDSQTERACLEIKRGHRGRI